MSFLKADRRLRIKFGIGGNLYAFSTDRSSVESFCTKIGKSHGSVYYNDKFQCWVARMKSDKHKQATIQVMDEYG